MRDPIFNRPQNGLVWNSWDHMQENWKAFTDISNNEIRDKTESLRAQNLKESVKDEPKGAPERY